MYITLPSKMILRHSDIFFDRYVLFAGNLQDNLAVKLKTKSNYVHTQQYNHWQYLYEFLYERAVYSWIAKTVDINNCDTLIYFWPKNKKEANFQLLNLLSLLPLSSDIFIVGENRSGIYSAENMLQYWVQLKKMDTAYHTVLYHGYLRNKPIFNANSFRVDYKIDQNIIHTLPGVFGGNKIDIGTNLMITTLKAHNKSSEVLEIGSGSGVLSTIMAKRCPNINLWLCDVHAAAIEASKATLAANNIKGHIFPSNVFSNITKKFDMIISNPPFHVNLNTSFDMIKNLIQEAPKYLNKKGELRIVGKNFIQYRKLLDKTFKKHEIIAENGKFKVYSAIYNNPR